MNNFDTSTEINDRIAQIIRYYGLSANSFSKKIGISSTIIGNIVAGRRSKPSIEAIQAIYNSFDGINLEWLIVGKGSMLNKQESETFILNKPQKVHSTNNSTEQVEFLNEHIRELTQVIKNLSAK